MGLPALHIPETKVSEMYAILSSIDMMVEQHETRDPLVEAEGLPKFHYICSTPDGAAVLVRFGRVGGANGGLVVVLQPISPWRKLRATDRLLKQIEAVLRQHDATDLGSNKK